MAETLRFDITGDSSGAQRANRDLAATADLAAKGARILADSLDKQKRAAAASVGATLAMAKADAALKKEAEYATAATVEEVIAIDKQKRAAEEAALATDALGKSTKGAAGGASALVSPMGGLVAAGVALAPVIVTVGTGLAGLGLAAAGIVSPILKAAKASGGLQANMSKLDPAQQDVAKSLLQLQKTYDSFQRALKPVILADFNTAIKATRPLLAGVEPVAAATGKALAQVFTEIGAEFRSGTWQGFFNFMARTAGPDVRLLGDTFINLTKALPPLLEQLQPVAVDLLSITDAAAKLAGAAARVNQTTDQTGKHMGALQQVTTALRLALFAPGVGLYHALKLIGVIGPDVGKGINAVGTAAAGASYHVGTLGKAVTDLNTAESKSLDTQLAYTNALIAAGDDAQKLRQALKASANQVGLHTAAQRASFSAANTYIADLEQAALKAYASGRGASAAADAIRRGLPTLESAASHNKAYWQEVATLKEWLDKLRQEAPIREKINVLGLGKWSVAAASHAVAQGPGPFAAGGRVPGSGNSDSYAAMLTPGEVVVPKPMVSAGAVDHLRGHLPGFASGGIVPSYGGPLSGLQPWAARDVSSTNKSIIHSVAYAISQAVTNAIHRSFPIPSSGGGALGGSSAANRAIAMRLFPWSASEWPSFNYVEMREAGYSLTATNPSSGAYGMAQFINGPSEYYQWGGNPNTAGGQLIAMFNYIRSRYGTPSAAAAHEQAFNWYDRGGYLPPGLSIAYNGTGRPEMVIPSGRGGGPGTVVIEFRSGGSRLADLLVEVIRHEAKVRGGGNVQLAFGRRGA